MCTVTFIAKGNDDFILTSNRDELPERSTLSLQEYTEDNVKLIYPKDKVAGGTWIGLSEKNRLINLLNGAFEPHKRKSTYKMSRGVVVKKLLVAEDAIQEIKDWHYHTRISTYSCKTFSRNWYQYQKSFRCFNS